MTDWAQAAKDIGATDSGSGMQSTDWNAAAADLNSASPGKKPAHTSGGASFSAPPAPLVARDSKENPLITALSAGSRFGKHFVATGQFGLPDRAGEDTDRATIMHRLDDFVNPSHQQVPQNALQRTISPVMEPLEQSAAGIGIDTALDPTTYIPFGILGKGIGKVGSAALEHLPQWGKDAASVVGEGTQRLGDAFHWGGDARRSMTPEQYRDATLGSNRQGAREAEIARRLEIRRAGIFDHLNENQRLAAYQLLNGEVDVVADPVVMDAVKQGRSLLNDAGYIQATEGGRKRLAFGNAGVRNAVVKDRNAVTKPVDEFEAMVPDEAPAARPTLKKQFKGGLPNRAYPVADNLREFVAPADQGVLGGRNIRQHYLPGIGSSQTVADDLTRPKPFNLLHPFAGHALHREDFKIGDIAPEQVGATVAEHDAAVKRYLHNAATQASAGFLRDELGVKAGQASPALNKLFTVTPRATGEMRNWIEKTQDVVRLPADATRSLVTSFGLKHGLVNVPVLAALSEGARPAGAMFRDAGRMMKMTPEQKWEFQRVARDAGVIGPEFERKNQALNLVEKTPLATRAALGGAYGGYEGAKTDENNRPNASPIERGGAALLGGVLGAGGGAILPRAGALSNDLTWALDEAAKRSVFNAKVRNGMSHADAAAQTLKDTIDYAHRTPIANGLQDWGLAPFATFATKVPGAVAGSVARDPRKAIMLDRLSQGLLSNGKVDLPGMPLNDKGNTPSLSMSTPFSETAELATDQSRYVRAKMSDPARIIASLLAAGATHGARGSNYMTYGQPALPHTGSDGALKSGYIGTAAADYGPLGVGREFLDALDANEYSPEDALSALLGPLIGGHIR